MNPSFSSRIALPILALAFLIGSQTTTHAHGVLSREIGPGKIRFSYDDGSPVANGYVDVFDKDGRKIATGQADAAGEYDYSEHEGAARISVSDIHGHHLSHVVGAAEHTHGTDHHHGHGAHTHGHDHGVPPRSGGKTPITIAVVAVLFAVAAAFYFGAARKNGTSTE